MFVFVSGAVRSGKSTWAEKRALEVGEGPLVYLATACVRDQEMRDRVRRHQSLRSGKGFVTLERERDLAEFVPQIPPGGTVLLECLSSWLANEMFGRNGIVCGAEEAARKVLDALEVLRKRTVHLLVVSNDVFSDGILYEKGTEEFRKALGVLHLCIVEMADEAVECSSGLVWMHKETPTTPPRSHRRIGDK